MRTGNNERHFAHPHRETDTNTEPHEGHPGSSANYSPFQFPTNDATTGYQADTAYQMYSNLNNNFRAPVTTDNSCGSVSHFQ